MLFISWFARPTAEDQSSCLKYVLPGSYNYEDKHRSATEKAPFSQECSQELAKSGYKINHARVRIGNGLHAYRKAKQLLNNWGHFQLKWAWVNPTTCIKVGQRFCVCSQEFVPWVLMPLEILYVNHLKTTSNDIRSYPDYNPFTVTSISSTSKPKANYCFGSGTLRGHLLAGEERFSVELDDNDDVWYEIFSFSRPAHFLSSVGQPYVRFKQKLFAHQSTQAMLKAMSE